MPSGKFHDDAKEIRSRLLELPLFSDLDEFTLEALDYEIRLFCDPSAIPDGMPQRSSHFRRESHRGDSTLINQGDLTTELFVVLDGTVSAYRAEPNRGTQLLHTYNPGEWFGEVTALSHQPALATVRTDADCEVAVLDPRLLRKFHQEDEVFRQRIDQKYRELSLSFHLRSAPIFAAVSGEELKEIVDAAEFVTVAKGETLATEGDKADAFYLVRSGAVKCFKEEDKGQQQVLAYYMGNSSFGEHAIATGNPLWPGTYETMAWTDVVKVPRQAFERIRAERPEVHRVLTNTANLILEGDSESLSKLYRERLTADEIDVMVFRESVKGGEALVIDQKKCIRCNACVEACVAVHDDRVPRISKVGTKVSSDDVLITACYHCAIPECMGACNYGAIRRDAQGVVVFVYDNCVGCGFCIDACPYGVIRMTDLHSQEPSTHEEGAGSGFLRKIPLLRDLLGLGKRPAVPQKESVSSSAQLMSIGGVEERVQGKAIKCDRCAGLPFEACVYNCPTTAISRRRPEELFKK